MIDNRESLCIQIQFVWFSVVIALPFPERVWVSRGLYQMTTDRQLLTQGATPVVVYVMNVNYSLSLNGGL